MKGLLLYSNIAEEVETVGGTALLEEQDLKLLLQHLKKIKRLNVFMGQN